MAPQPMQLELTGQELPSPYRPLRELVLPDRCYFVRTITMGDATDLAGAIGTWVAVGLAMVALLGVLAPFLVWRASRTDRSKALIALDAGLADSGGYVSKGLKIRHDIRLFQRVEAPILSRSPNVARKVLVWDAATRLPSRESAGWVQFSKVAISYGLMFRTGDVLTVDKRATKLPVSRAWIFVIGLVGRFAHRRDGGKWPKHRPKGIRSERAPPGRRIASAATTPARNFAKSTAGWMTGLQDWAGDNGGASGRFTPLSGLCGTLEYKNARMSDNATAGEYRAEDNFSFRAHEDAEIGDNISEQLGIHDLFWLSVGCLPMSDGRVLSLENVQALPHDLDPGISDSDVKAVNWAGVESSAATSGVHFADDFVLYSTLRNPFGTPAEMSSAAYVTPVGLDPQITGNTTGSYQSTNKNTPRRFRMSFTDDRVEDLVGLAELVGAETAETRALGLEEVATSPDEVAIMNLDASSTYVPCQRTYVRLTPKLEKGKVSSAWFLERQDAQLLSRALVELPICMHGVLMYKAKGAVCRRMLAAASQLLPRMLARIGSDIALLTLDAAAQIYLENAIWDMLRCITPFKYTRTFAAILLRLDEALKEACTEDPMVQMVVQVITQTNAEFRDLTSQSVRNIKECLSLTVTLDMTSSTLNVVSAMGMVQKFPVDIDVLFTNPTAIDRSKDIVIPYKSVLLLVTKATLKSAYLETCLDSEPLFSCVMGMDEVAFVA